MPRYPLQDLLKVRQFREDNAAQALTLRRRQVAAAEEALQQRRREVEDYHAWRIRREEELYDELMNRLVSRNDLDDLKATIESLRAEEFALQDRVREAEQLLAKAREDLQAAQAALVKAQRDRQKITEHKELWLQEQARESESRQDKELEEFKSAQFDVDEAPDEEPDHAWSD